MLVYRTPDWDYRCYVNAGELLRLGKSPYSPELGTQYLYPPPLAHLLGGALAAVPATAIFWIFQASQVLLTVAAFLMLRLCATRAGVSRDTASLIAAAVLLLNLPLFYNLRHHQVNLFILDAALVAMLFPARAAAAGLALAAATQLKLYPALLLVPLAAFGYRRVALWWFAGVLAPLAFAGVRRDWFEFVRMLPDMPKGEAILDNSVTSLIERGLGGVISPAAVKIAAGLAALAALAIVTMRLLRAVRDARADRPLAFLRVMAEWSAVVLFISPIAWDHHFLVALPLIVLLIAGGGARLLVIAGCALVLLVPRTPIYPISHHHLFGLILLLAASGRRHTR